MKFTPRQWDAVRTTDRHVLVSAGAGTGKTRTVVGRILFLLGVEINGVVFEHPVQLSDLVAITFTNAAAADLKQKVRRALRDAGRPREAYAVDNARIGTIHAFCSDVLRRFALRSGASPRQEVLDEPTMVGLTAQAVRDTLVAALERADSSDVDELLADWSVREVERFVLDLLSDLDRLGDLLARRDEFPASERALLSLAERASAMLDTRLDERGVIDFDRIIVRTRDLLARDVEALTALRRTIHTLIIDEFQDVDPVQKEIAYLIGDPSLRQAKTPTLMLVGDAKQSIYRFRRADVTAWSAVEHDFRRGLGSVITVADNFRSSGAILGFVDHTVGALLDEPLDGSDRRPCETPYYPLEIAEAKQAEGVPVELIVVPTRPDGSDFLSEDVRAIEAHAVANRARELVETGETEWGAIAILVPTWATAATHLQAIEGVGGKAITLKPTRFFEQREIVDLIIALETIRDPYDDRALIGFLRSPFVGLEDATLLDLARQTPAPYWPSLHSVRTREQELLMWGVALLERLGRLRDRVPLDELLETLFDQTGYLAHLRLLGPHRFQSLANVERFVRLVQTMGHQTLGEFLRIVSDVRKAGTDDSDVPQVPPADAATITTIHSAKGLEWDVVFWCDMARMARFRDNKNLLIGRTSLSLKGAELDAQQAPVAWREIRDELATEDSAERKRLWYVAATRAKRRLIVSGLRQGRATRDFRSTVGDHLWSVLGPVRCENGATFAYESHHGLRYEGRVRLGDPTVLERLAARPAPTPVPTVEPASVLAPPLPDVALVSGRPRHSATQLLTFSRCPRRHWFKYVVGVREPEVDRTSAEFIDAVTRGRIVHDVLEHLRERDELDRLLEDAIYRCDPDAPTPEQPEGRRYRSMLRAEITQVTENTDYRRVAGNPTARRELRFLHIQSPDVFFEGAIDLAAVEPPQIVLLDVKTSSVDAGAARDRAARFLRQRDVYVTAAEAISSKRVARFAFHFSRPSVHVSAPIDDAAREASSQAIQDDLQAIGQGDKRLTDHPAECRFCGYRAVGWCPGVEPRDPHPSQLSLNLA